MQNARLLDELVMTCRTNDHKLIVGAELSAEELLDALQEAETLTVILEPQEKLNQAIHSYSIDENKLVYDDDLLIEIFADDFAESDPEKDSVELINMARDWAYSKCDIGIIFLSMEASQC